MGTSKEVSPKQRIHRLQKKIFQALKTEVDTLLGKMPHSILKYERECRQDFRLGKKNFSTVHKKELIQAIRNTEVSFVADFHTFDQAQRTALRILREAYSPNENWMLGLEMIPSQYQQALDDFQEGILSLEEFHQAISYQEQWGFPWKNYSPLFDWARDNGVRLIALNRPKPFFLPIEEKELYSRDQWAAGILTDLFHSYQNHPSPLRVVVLYGEHHVGALHLPQQLTQISKVTLGKPLTWLTIHQNQEALYWKIIEQNLDTQSNAIKLKKNIYCLFSATPWTKLQSVLNWEDRDSAESSESEVDYLSLIRSYGTTLSELLSIPAPTFEAITPKTIDDADFMGTDSLKRHFNTKELQLIGFHIHHNRCIYLPRVDIAYLGSPSHHRAAEIAALHLLRTHLPCTILFIPTENDFYRLVLETAFSFVCTLILNPHRKCDLLTDHQQRITDFQKGEKPGFPHELEARKLVVSLLLDARSYGGVSLASLLTQPKHASTLMMSARYLGKVLGKRLHQALVSGTVDFATVNQLFFLNLKRMSPSIHREGYEMVLASLAVIKEPLSKSEVL